MTRFAQLIGLAALVASAALGALFAFDVALDAEYVRWADEAPPEDEAGQALANAFAQTLPFMAGGEQAEAVADQTFGDACFYRRTTRCLNLIHEHPQRLPANPQYWARYEALMLHPASEAELADILIWKIVFAANYYPLYRLSTDATDVQQMFDQLESLRARLAQPGTIETRILYAIWYDMALAWLIDATAPELPGAAELLSSDAMRAALRPLDDAARSLRVSAPSEARYGMSLARSWRDCMTIAYQFNTTPNRALNARAASLKALIAQSELSDAHFWETVPEHSIPFWRRQVHTTSILRRLDLTLAVNRMALQTQRGLAVRTAAVSGWRFETVNGQVCATPTSIHEVYAATTADPICSRIGRSWPAEA